jgi:2-methylfumaryl-CoA hydratase
MNTTNKGWQGNFFEDFSVGQELTCPVPRTITAGDTSLYVALTGDRTPVYSSTSTVHPLVVFHVSFGQTVRTISLNARANLGYADVRWGAAVTVGDTLTTRLRIIGLKENSNGKTGVVFVANECRNQRGEVVLTYTRWVMIFKRAAAATPWLDAAVTPELPESVSVSTLVDSGILAGLSPMSMLATGGCHAFEDYEVAEVIQHLDPMAVNPSDHMLFTRLFQNSAKVHFDRHGMSGKPLVYGGVIISLGYALSFNGLENRLGMVAINGGQHVAPTYEGDTIHAITHVVDKVEVNDALGLLRLQLVVFKNLPGDTDPSEIAGATTDGRNAWGPSVVLALDYWEAMARRGALRAD